MSAYTIHIAIYIGYEHTQYTYHIITHDAGVFMHKTHITSTHTTHMISAYTRHTYHIRIHAASVGGGQMAGYTYHICKYDIHIVYVDVICVYTQLLLEDRMM